MNEFQQYQQQLQMQRTMEMQQARMQQLQQQQNNMMLFSQQRAAAAAFINPAGATPMMNGPIAMGTMAGGSARQGLFGLAAEAGRFGFLGIGTQGGLFGTGIGGRIGFRFADPNRAITQARAEDQLRAYSNNFVSSIGGNVLASFGMDRIFGQQGNAGSMDAAMSMMDIFGSVRGENASGIQGRGISATFADRATRRARNRLASAMPEFTSSEITEMQGLAAQTMSTAQLTQAARSESDFDKMMESQEALLKKIAENTKMTIEEVKETNKVFKGQGGTGGSLQAMATVSDAVARMQSTTGMTQEELLNMGAGFRAGARSMGMRNLESVSRLMISRTDATLRAFNNGEIDETSMAAFGGTTPGEQAAAREQVLMQRSRQFAVNTQTGIGLLGGQAGLIAASQGFAAQQMAVGAAIASNPINAAADAIYSAEGQARLDRATVGAQQTAYLSAVAFQRELPGASRSVAVQKFAQTMGLNPVQALTAFDRIDALQGRIEGLGAAGNALSPSIIQAIDEADRATGLGDRTAKVAELISQGKSPEEAIKEAYTPRTAEEVSTVATKTGNLGVSARSLMDPGTAGFTVAPRGSARGGVLPGTGTDGGLLGTGALARNMDASDRATNGGGMVSVSEMLYISENDTERGERIDRAEDYGMGVRQMGAGLANQVFKGLKIVDDGPTGVLGSANNAMHVIVQNSNDFAQTVSD